MRGKELFQIILMIMGAMAALFLILRPTYEMKVFHLGFYPYTPVTQMIYSGFSDRKLLYIYGNYNTEAYPDKDYIVLEDFSGFDSISQIIADCDSNRTITIYSTSGPSIYKNPTGSTVIVSRQADYDTYTEMKENHIGRYIVAE